MTNYTKKKATQTNLQLARFKVRERAADARFMWKERDNAFKYASASNGTGSNLLFASMHYWKGRYDGLLHVIKGLDSLIAEEHDMRVLGCKTQEQYAKFKKDMADKGKERFTPDQIKWKETKCPK